MRQAAVTLNAIAVRSIHAAMVRARLTVKLAYRDPSIAAWLVWSMRGTPLAKNDYKTFNRARRVLQRAGRSRI